MLIRVEVVKEYAVEVLDSDVEDVLWVRLSNEEEEEGCYLPPETSSRGKGGEKAMQSCAEQVAKLRSLGQIMMCGDFNTRCRMLKVECEGLLKSKVIDEVNNQGEMFVDFLRNVNMGVAVNGRKEKDAFTCVSGKDCSVVENCMVGQGISTSSTILEW